MVGSRGREEAHGCGGGSPGTGEEARMCGCRLDVQGKIPDEGGGPPDTGMKGKPGKACPGGPLGFPVRRTGRGSALKGGHGTYPARIRRVVFGAERGGVERGVWRGGHGRRGCCRSPMRRGGIGGTGNPWGRPGAVCRIVWRAAFRARTARHAAQGQPGAKKREEARRRMPCGAGRGGSGPVPEAWPRHAGLGLQRHLPAMLRRFAPATRGHGSP